MADGASASFAIRAAQTLPFLAPARGPLRQEQWSLAVQCSEFCMHRRESISIAAQGCRFLMEKLTPATMTAAVNGRSVVYAPEIQDLLAREAKVFRVNAALVGVSDFHLISAAVAARPVLPSERSVFKPAAGADINHDSATRTIRALGQDVMTGIQTPPPPAHRLCGAWPYAATSYLR